MEDHVVEIFEQRSFENGTVQSSVEVAFCREHILKEFDSICRDTDRLRQPATPVGGLRSKIND